MKNILLHITFALLFVLNSSFSVDEKLIESSSHAFHIERSKDANALYYDINLNPNGTLNQKNPIKVYWIKYAEKGQKESLTWIQKNYAYGLKFTDVDKYSAKFKFVSYGKETLTIKKNKHNKYKICASINNKEIELNKIFIKITGGSFWFPKIPEVKLYGKDAQTHQPMVETIKP